MKTTVKKLSDTKVQLSVSLQPSELAAAEQVSLAKLARNIKVPGFRKGKVPASVAAKHVSPSALQEQILENAISKAVAEAFINEDIPGLFASVLGPTERSAVFQLATVNSEMDDEEILAVYFFYLNLQGAQRFRTRKRATIARVEVPDWVAREPASIDK